METTPYSASTADRLHEVAERAKEARAEAEQRIRGWYEHLRALGTDLDSQVRGRPYATAGAAVGLGFGIGAFFGSTIVRALLLSVGGYAVSELLRKHAVEWLEDLLKDVDSTTPSATTPRQDPTIS